MIDESAAVLRNCRYSDASPFVQVFAMTFAIRGIKILFPDRKTLLHCSKLDRERQEKKREGRGKGELRIPRMQPAELQLHFSPARNSPSRDELPAIELATGAYRRNGESQNWPPGYRGCRWKVDDGYGGTISSFNARSLLIRWYYFGTSPRTSPGRKKRPRGRVNGDLALPMRSRDSVEYERTRRFPKVIGTRKRDGEKKKARPRSEITARQFPKGFGFMYVKQCREGELVIFQIQSLSWDKEIFSNRI